MNWELPDVQAGFRKGRGNRDQITNTHWIIEKARGYLKKKNLLLLHWLHLILWLCGSQQTVENFSGDGNTRPPTCLLRSLYAGQKATVTTRHGTRNWFQIGKELLQDSILSPCLFNLQSEYIMQNTGASASASVLPMNIQDWLPLGLTGLICFQPKGLSRVFSNTTVQKHQFFGV